MSKAGKQMIEGLKEAITMNSLMIENKMLTAELRQADDKALKQALTIKKLQEENETLRRDVKTAVMGDSAELQDVKRENEKLNDTRIDYICKINKLVDERAKLRKALLAVYDNSLGLDPDKITDDIELVTAEIRAAREALGE